MSNKIVFIVGPTASGKTDISLKIAERFNGEIVSADSMQIYKGIHVASAAPTDQEKSKVKHHLFEFLNLTDNFSVAQYVKLATKTADEIISRGKLPIFVGGTGLYFKSFSENLTFTECEVDEQLRNKLEHKYDKIGGEALLKELSVFDNYSAQKLKPNDKKRIVRAFEVYLQSGISISKQNELSHKNDSPFNFLKIGISYENRDLLYRRINNRIDLMIENGLIEEAKTTLNCANNKGAFQAIGHKEFYPYLMGKCSFEEAVESLKMQTRRYAKRQITWFKKDADINWYYHDTNDNFENDILNSINNFLKEDE